MGMTTAGWIFLALAWTLITSLVVFCFRKIFTISDTTYEHPEKTEGPGSAPGA